MKLLIALIIVLLIQGCTMFPKEETFLAKHTKPNGEEIEIVYVGLGATTNDVIQVRKSKTDDLLWISEKYNCLNSSLLINDSTLRLVLSDTSYLNTSKMDTLIVHVK